MGFEPFSGKEIAKPAQRRSTTTSIFAFHQGETQIFINGQASQVNVLLECLFSQEKTGRVPRLCSAGTRRSGMASCQTSLPSSRKRTVTVPSRLSSPLIFHATARLRIVGQGVDTSPGTVASAPITLPSSSATARRRPMARIHFEIGIICIAAPLETSILLDARRSPTSLAEAVPSPSRRGRQAIPERPAFGDNASTNLAPGAESTGLVRFRSRRGGRILPRAGGTGRSLCCDVAARRIRR